MIWWLFLLRIFQFSSGEQLIAPKLPKWAKNIDPITTDFRSFLYSVVKKIEDFDVLTDDLREDQKELNAKIQELTDGFREDKKELNAKIQELTARVDKLTTRLDDLVEGGCSGDTCTRQKTGSLLPTGKSLVSKNGRVTLVMQTDGNLVIYCKGKGHLWHTRTSGVNINKGLFFQADGNLVLYNKSGKPVWYSTTHGTDANNLVLLNDGNLVLYGMRNGHVYWSSGSGGKC